ncbi:MAG: type I glutamate--ammonia ligase [Streptosporangiaceae bacterium]
MNTSRLSILATVDLAGICRGRAMPGEIAASVGWVPANLGITAFATLADNPFGSLGDLRICADPATTVPLPARDGHVTLTLGDLRNGDGTDWDCCPRGLLRRSLDELQAHTGLTIRAAFEHEFVLEPDEPAGHPFSVQRLVSAEPFGTHLIGALAQAGLEPETWLPEFGHGQWEVTVRPASGLAAADRAILLREIVRASARAAGRTAVFAPTPPGCGATSGAHIHFSLWTGDGEPATHGDREHGLSETAAHFAAGILEHAPALLAFTAPSVVSYQRLGPGHWSADSPRLAFRDREALLRIPGPASATDDQAAQTHFEYRAADSTANPWLALGAIVRAGLDGVTRHLADPEHARPAAVFPRSLEEALAALDHDQVMSEWMPADMKRTYLSVKNSEAAGMRELSDDEVHARYARAY